MTGGRKGTPKTGGRQKGTPNKTTAFTKELIKDILSDYSSSGLMSKDFKELESKDRLQIAEKLMQYIMPKMQSVGVEISDKSEVSIEDKLRQLAEENE